MPDTTNVVRLRSADAPAAREQRVLELRQMLDLMRHPTTAETLQVLRQAFPDIPLKDRVAELERKRG